MSMDKIHVDPKEWTLAVEIISSKSKQMSTIHFTNNKKIKV